MYYFLTWNEAYSHICQLYISQTLVNISMGILLIHYIDDLLLAHWDAVYLQRTTEKVLKDLMSLYLMVVTDKVQMVPTPFASLDFSRVWPLFYKLEMKELYSFSESQQLCGTVNWFKPILHIPNQKMRHLPIHQS